MVKDNRISTIVDDELFIKFKRYWIDRENITQERVSASAVARDLIEYALDSMNGKKATKRVEKLPDKMDTEQDAKQDEKKNPFSDINF